jgi:hypothetical protein
MIDFDAVLKAKANQCKREAYNSVIKDENLVITLN